MIQNTFGVETLHMLVLVSGKVVGKFNRFRTRNAPALYNLKM